MLEEEIKPLHVTGQHCWIILSTLSHQEHQIHSEAKWQEGTVHWAALIRQWIRALLLIGLLCNQRGNLVFLLLLLLQQPAREKRDSPAGIPTVQGPRSNQTPSRHIPGPDHTPRAGDSSLQCVWENSRQQPLEHKSCCLMTLHKGCGTEPGSLQGAVLLPQHVLCHGHLGKRAGHLEPLLEDFYPKTSPSPQNKSQTSMT